MSGETYQPQYLTLEQYQTILAGITGRSRSASTGSLVKSHHQQQWQQQGFQRWKIIFAPPLKNKTHPL